MIGVVTPTSPLSKPQSLSFSNVNVFKHPQTSPLSNSPSPFFNPLDPPAPTRFLTLLSLSFSHHPSLPSFFNSRPTAFQPYHFPTPSTPTVYQPLDCRFPIPTHFTHFASNRSHIKSSSRQIDLLPVILVLGCLGIGRL